MNENMKKISEWQVLTPDGFKDFEGVKKVTKEYVLKFTLENEQQIICSGGHQLFVKQKKQDILEEDTEGFLFADLIQPFEMLIQTRNHGYQTVLCVEKICESQDMFDLVNVADGYQYYTNDILSHNCAHVEGIDDLWLGLWPTLSCLVGKTKVFTDKGIFSIEDFHKNRFIGEYFEIDGWNVYGKNGLERLSHGYVSPESDTVELTTKHRYNVEGTLKHPLWVLDELGGAMKQIQHIRLGDYLRIQVGMNCYGTNELDSDLAYMLGGYSAEGCIKKRKRNRNGRVEYTGIQITNSDPEFREVFLNRAENTMFGKNFRAYGKHNLTLYSVSAVKKLQDIGLDINQLAYNKTVPSIIWTATKQTQQNYLSGLFDGDGTAYKGFVKIELTSEQMIKDIQILLLNMGYHPNVNKKKARTKLTNTRSARTSWVLGIPKSESKKFAEEISFRIKRKQEQLLAVEQEKHSDLNRCPINVIKSQLLNIIEKSQKPISWYQVHGLKTHLLQTKNNTSNRCVSVTWLQKFQNLVYLANPSLVDDQHITSFFDNVIGNFFWDPVVELKDGKAKTYDFTVPRSHTFVQNGILGSNTGGSAILISSPSGVGTLFHKIWVGAKEGEDGEGNPNPGKGQNNFYRIELPWTVHPERDKEWYEAQRAEILPAKGERGVAQELLCVGNDTNILTLDGYKKAADINVGDFVLTHKGRYKKVLNVAERYLKPDENLYALSLPGNRKSLIHITGNHPLYNYHYHLPKGRNQFDYLKQQIRDGQLKADFNSIDDLLAFSSKTNKRVVSVMHPKLQITDDNVIWDLHKLYPSKVFENEFVKYEQQKYTNKRHVSADYNLGYFIGLAVAEGCLIKNRSKKGTITETLQLAFRLSEERNSLGKWIENYLSNLNIKFTLRERTYSDCFTISTCNKFLIELYKQYVVDGNARNKHLKLDTVLSSGKKFVKGYLSGHFAGDGDHVPALLKNNNSNKLKVVCKSQKLLYQIRTLLTGFGHYGRIGYLNNEPSYLEIDGLSHKGLKTIEEVISEPRTANVEQRTSRIKLLDQTGEFVGNPIWSLVNHEKVKFVVDIEVEEDHSFIADSIVVHNCSFAASGENFLSADVIEDMEKQIKTPIATYGDRGDVWIWKYAEPNHKYIISADVSRGDADDYSTIHVFDTNTDEVVCEYQGKCPPEKLAELMMDLGFKYNQALLCPELNSFGLIVATDIKKAQYPNIYYERIHRSNAYMSYTTADIANDLPGFTTGPKNRDEILAKLETVIRTRRIKIYSSRTVEEFKTFVWKNNKAQAMKSYNDDLIIALAIGNSLYEAAGVNAWDDKAVTTAMIAGMSKTTSTMSPLGNQFGEKNKYMPPVMTSDNIKEYAKFQDMQNEHEQKNSGAVGQDFRHPYWSRWAWVLK